MVGTTISHYKVIEKIGQAGVLAVLMVFPLALSAQNPSALTTVWGPEEFVLSSDCKNATRSGVCRGSADVSLDGFGAPFMLHVRNGHEDGKNRVPRARIWLNGQLLFGRLDISQQKSGDLVKVIHQSVAEYALAVELIPAKMPVTEPSSLRGSLTVWIEGTPSGPSSEREYLQTLEGEPQSVALRAFYKFGSPYTGTRIGPGFYIKVTDDATLGELNALLRSVGASILQMNPSLKRLFVRIPDPGLNAALGQLLNDPAVQNVWPEGMKGNPLPPDIRIPGPGESPGRGPG